MSNKIKLSNEVEKKIKLLENHKLYLEINNLERLIGFMERHVFAVFDFMSLTKVLQNEFAPVGKVWTPPRDNSLARFINEIVLCEESDETFDGRTMSHFEMYCIAMAEVRANSDRPQLFASRVREKGLAPTLGDFDLPESSKTFMANTFKTIDEKGIHEIAASFCYGREKVIPLMFQSLLEKMNITSTEAPMFHFYLKRHIEVDGDSHGPLAIKMLEVLCGEDQIKWQEVNVAALSALDARLKFWDDVVDEITCL